jgi:hypothetical protein
MGRIFRTKRPKEQETPENNKVYTNEVTHQVATQVSENVIIFKDNIRTGQMMMLLDEIDQ